MYLSTKPDPCRRDSGVMSDVDSSSSKCGTPEKAAKETSSLEYAKLWEELRNTGQGLDDLFEQSKNSAYDIKSAYDSIHQLITINEGRKLKYYEALTSKKKFEEERDEYFKADVELSKRKDEFIEDSQRHALQHSRYVEYSKRFSKRREEYIERLLKDVERYLNQVESLSREKQNLRTEVSKQRSEIYSLRNNLKTLSAQHETALQSCEKFKKELEVKRKENQWLNNQVEKQKATKQRLDDDIGNLKRKEEELQNDLQKYVKTIDELSEKRRELVDRCSQLHQLLEGKTEELAAEEEERDLDKKRHEEEVRELQKCLNDTECQKRNLRDSNIKLLKQLGQMRKRFDETKKRGATVEKEKNKSVSREHQTSEKNVELTTQHLQLIDEVLALKKTFYEDQEKLKRGGRQYKRMDAKMNALKQQIDILKENPMVMNPEEFSKDYREQVVKRIVNSPVQNPPRYGSTYHDTVPRSKRTPVIGHVSKPNIKPDDARLLDHRLRLSRG